MAYGETSAGFWALQADDWTGYPIGFEPPAPDPWHLDNWGWLNPLVITDTSQGLHGHARPGQRLPRRRTDVYRGAKIELPDRPCSAACASLAGQLLLVGRQGGPGQRA